MTPHLQPLRQLGASLLRTFRERLRPLTAFHLLFTLLASTLVLPGIAWATRALFARLGTAVVTLDDLVALLFTPVGLISALAAQGLAFCILYWQQAGMLHVATSRHARSHYHLTLAALWASTRRLPALAGLVVLQVGSHLLLLAPFMAGIAWLYDAWLGGLDTYYLQQVRPPVVWYFIACALPLLLLWAWLAGRPALPALAAGATAGRTGTGSAPPCAFAQCGADSRLAPLYRRCCHAGAGRHHCAADTRHTGI